MHSWVSLTDMQPTEGALFKQYDFRQSAKEKGEALATFHCSSPDPYHRNTNLPGRRSIECRIILTFEPEPSSVFKPAGGFGRRVGGGADAKL